MDTNHFTEPEHLKLSYQKSLSNIIGCKASLENVLAGLSTIHSESLPPQHFTLDAFLKEDTQSLLLERLHRCGLHFGDAQWKTMCQRIGEVVKFPQTFPTEEEIARMPLKERCHIAGRLSDLYNCFLHATIFAGKALKHLNAEPLKQQTQPATKPWWKLW